MSEILSKLLHGKIIAIIRGISSRHIVQTARALQKGGIQCLEVPFDQADGAGYKDTIASLELLSGQFADSLVIGAGTVLTATSVDEAARAGAKFIVSPNADKTVIRRSKERGLVSVPGALTPTEITDAYNWGADIIKLFPAGVFGVSYVKAIRAPLSHIPLFAVGGITPENIRSFLDAGMAGAGVGGKLVDNAAIKRQDFEALTRAAQEYFKAIAD